ncbi:hypothetical protein SSTU70S_05560 [Stutzerimonas stutzeri]
MKGFSCKRYRQCGFTLVELIMVIALAGIVAVMISTVMSRPLQASSIRAAVLNSPTSPPARSIVWHGISDWPYRIRLS